MERAAGRAQKRSTGREMGVETGREGVEGRARWTVGRYRKQGWVMDWIEGGRRGALAVAGAGERKAKRESQGRRDRIAGATARLQGQMQVRAKAGVKTGLPAGWCAGSACRGGRG